MAYNDDFVTEIATLIEIGTEGGYWDFKQKWHENNADLLHDIICMANNLENRDAYIIIGVTEDTASSTTTITGVPAEDRKNQQNVIDFLKNKKFAGGVRPTVYVKTITLPTEIDVIVIKNSVNTPYYLAEQFDLRGKCVKAGYIYTRIGDTNTPKTSMADIDKVEYLWRKRFGIDLSIMDKLLILLDQPKEWQGDFKNGNTIFHRVHPEFQIILDDTLDDPQDFSNNSIAVNLAAHECNTKFEVRQLDIKYNSTVIYSENVIYLDGYRILIPLPNTDTIYVNRRHELEQSLTYLYFDKSTVMGKLYIALTEEWYAGMGRVHPGFAFLLFNENSEKSTFDEFVKIHLEQLLHDYTVALTSKEIVENSETEEYFQYGWSKANEIKAHYMFNKCFGVDERNLETYIPSYLANKK